MKDGPPRPPIAPELRRRVAFDAVLGCLLARLLRHFLVLGRPVLGQALALLVRALATQAGIVCEVACGLFPAAEESIEESHL